MGDTFTKAEVEKLVADEIAKAKKQWIQGGVGSLEEKSDLLNFNPKLINSWTVGLKGILDTTQSTMQSVSNALAGEGLNKDPFLKLLDEQATSLSATMGVGKGRMEEFRQSIADVSPDLIRMGIEQENAVKNIEKMAEGLGGAASIGKEAIVEMSAAAQGTGQEIGTLTKNFREVGISIYDVGDEMLKVANAARSAGVSVAGVSNLVVSNIGKLNLYNFNNGIEGLTKMSVQAARLGVDMSKVFKIADDLFSPEKAIEMSAELQRLGVTSGALLDPLRAMDMAQNDPAALQNEILNISKEFTKFNEQTNKFEIMPGAQRRLREVAGALGMTADELAGMSIKAADFDKKMSQIKLPSFAEGNKETKELIASMAQMKDGVATINVKDEKTGEVVLKQVDQLTPEDITKLKESQTEQAKTVEQLAYDQLTQLQQINLAIGGTKAAVGFGRATAEPVEKLFTTMMKLNTDYARGINQPITTEGTRKPISQVLTPVEESIKSLLKGDEQGYQKNLSDLVKNLSDMETKGKTAIDDAATKTFQEMKNTFEKAYGDPKKVEASGQVTVKHEVTVNGGPNTANLSKSDFQNVAEAAFNDQDFAKSIYSLMIGKSPSAETGTKNKPQ